MTVSARRLLDPTYPEARRRFLAAAERAGAELAAFPHPMAGLDGEELALDVAQLGDPDADSVLLLVSATHGVEGYAGSALQSWWLDERSSDLPGGNVRVIVVHGFNPTGFSWVRRVNEDNVDLNRNFVDWPTPPSNEAYGGVADLLVPGEWSESVQEATTAALFEHAGEVGLDRFQQVVSGGQYDHPTGIFYGGTEKVWSHRWAAEHLAGLVAPASRLGVIDLHTGLGEWGHGELIAHDGSGDPGYQRATAWWGDVRSMVDGESVSAELTGDWLGALDDLVPGVDVTAVALEFGTVDVFTVLQALRADAWLHGHGDPVGEYAAPIRAQVRAAFADDDPAWLAKLIARFDEVASAAISGLVS